MTTTIWIVRVWMLGYTPRRSTLKEIGIEDIGTIPAPCSECIPFPAKMNAKATIVHEQTSNRIP